MHAVAEELRKASGPVSVALDEGGLRCTWRHGGAAYVPFETLADATVDTTLFGATVLVATLVSGEEVRVKIANADPFGILGAIVAHVGERGTDASVAARASHPALERGDLELGPWLENIRRNVCEGMAYRDAPPDRAAFATLLDDDRAPAAWRAGAAFALLTIGLDDDLATVARVLVSRALPPVVLVAAGLAPGGSMVVDAELLCEMQALLPPRDRDVLAHGPARRDDAERGARVASALTAAKQAASDQAREAAEAHTRAHAEPSRRPLHPVSTGAGDGGRWVGRSWGL